MNEPSTERRAYFASLATPELIVCATIERGRFTEADLNLIRDELRRRGIDPDRLLVPEDAAHYPEGAAPVDFSGPLPGAGQWWAQTWGLFKREWRFLAVVALVFSVFQWILQRPLIGWGGSFGQIVATLSHAVVVLAFDTLYAGAVICGLHKRTSSVKCSVGRSIALAIHRFSWIFKNTLKAATIAFGGPFALIAIGTGSDETGLTVLGWVLAIYPGTYLLLRYFWVQPLAVIESRKTAPLQESRVLSEGRYRHLLAFLLLLLLVGWGTFIAALIVKAILPGPFLESLAWRYMFGLFMVITKVALLVGYYHARSPEPEGRRDAVADPSPRAIPPPPGL